MDTAVQSFNVGRCENITVRKADGRVFKLGRPGTFMFKVRLAIYKLKMRLEGLK